MSIILSMKSFILLGLLSSTALAAFKNGPGSKLKNGGHTAGYEPIIKLSEELIATELGENSTALEPYPLNVTVDDIGTSPVDDRSILKRQDTRPAGALKCAPGAPCIDDSCCGSNGICGFKSENCGTGCTSNCDAKAHCGVDSLNSSKKCGLKLCCSHYGWCGTKDVHCIDPEPQFGKSPCQQGFGGCAIIPKPECGGGSSAGWRRIAYYAGWNTKDRPCDKVYPKDINIKGLTHLMYSFVGFNPTTFEIEADPHDVPQFKEFTSRGSSTLKTWIAVGGWAFNDPGNTQTAFSNMVSTSGNRAAFIRSLIKFMDQYGFTGADIDWEYPSHPERGGKDADKDNLTLLMKDMKAAFGTKYGLSVVIAPDYWYLQGFAPKDMQEYVDHLGFMAYDLHGPWDSENALGNKMRPHTDIRDIDEGLTPLWFDGVDPKKVVMGIAYYGRSFTAASKDCPVMGCGFTGPGKKYGCTQSDGVLSNIDIRKIIKEKGVKPELLEGAMVKELIFDGDQWVAYDDEETIALKEAFARKRCLGGTMIWSIDYDSPSSTNGNNPTVPALPSTGGTQVPECNKNGGKEYLCKNCDGDIGDTRKTDKERWNLARGDEALLEHNLWRIELHKGQFGGIEGLGEQSSYVRSLAWRFDGPEDWICSLVKTGTCDDVVSCRETRNPAVSMIMTQFAALRNFYLNQYEAVTAAAEEVDKHAGNFATIFSPELKPDKSLKILMDTLSMGFGIFAATPFTMALKTGVTSGFNKGLAGAVVASSMSIGKDQLEDPPKALDNQNALTSALGQTASYYSKVLNDIVNELFSGSEKGRVALEAQFKDAGWTNEILQGLDVKVMQSQIESILYGTLLTQAWEIREVSHVFIAVVDEKDHTGNPSNVLGGGPAVAEISNSDMEESRVTIGDQTFWLLDYGDCEKIVNDEMGFPSCNRGGARVVPGLASLKSADSVWKLHFETIVKSCVNAWKISGGSNDYSLNEFQLNDKEKTELPWEAGLATPGFFPFPVCDYKMAAYAHLMVTYEGEEPCENYPCCMYDSLTRRGEAVDKLTEYYKNGRRWMHPAKPRAVPSGPRISRRERIWGNYTSRYGQ